MNVINILEDCESTLIFLRVAGDPKLMEMLMQ